jgi:hypothetical protein
MSSVTRREDFIMHICSVEERMPFVQYAFKTTDNLMQNVTLFLNVLKS